MQAGQPRSSRSFLPPQERLVDTVHLNPASAQWVGYKQSGNIERVQTSEPVEHIRSWVF